MTCPACKNQIADGLKFCPKCGTRQEAATSGVPQPPPGSGVPAPPPQSHQHAAPGPEKPHRPAPPRDSSHDLTPAAPLEIEVKDPTEKNHNFLVYAVAAVIACVIIAAAFFFLKPLIFRTKDTPIKKPAPTRPAPTVRKPAAISPTGELPRLNEDELDERQKQVADRMKEIFDADISKNYFKVYGFMTPKLRKWMNDSYPGMTVDTAATYADMRAPADEEPQITAAKLVGEVPVKGGRAEATANITAQFKGKEIKMRYVYVLLEQEGIWRIDGVSAGPQGPIRGTASADFDGDSEQEQLIFFADFLRYRLRWEVVEPNGAQSYVFEISAFNDCDPGDDEHTYKVFKALADKQPDSHEITPAEEASFKANYPQFATARGIADATLSKRKGFSMSDACGGSKYFVLFVNGLNYVEIPIEVGQ